MTKSDTRVAEAEAQIERLTWYGSLPPATPEFAHPTLDRQQQRNLETLRDDFEDPSTNSVEELLLR